MRMAHDVRTAPGMVSEKDSEDDDSFGHGFVLNGGANADEPHGDISADEARASVEPALGHLVKRLVLETAVVDDGTETSLLGGFV